MRHGRDVPSGVCLICHYSHSVMSHQSEKSETHAARQGRMHEI
ncbi:hypothetical protein PUN4_1450010 [Paraburkholderia unamae]|nr:hypothetical protein PUN4_1450010 [Paraburkholderia unamae]